MKNKTEYILLGTLRILFSGIFLWAFLDKVFGLGFATKAGKAWINGVSPTVGFLKNATHGPLAAIFQFMAGNAIVDWLFMLGLLGIGFALLTGMGMRIATISGVILLSLMYLAALPPANNPLLDDHIIYIFTLLVLNAFQAGDYVGYGKSWGQSELVKKYPILR